MGAGSVGLLWYACCCGFFAFAGIVTVGLITYGRRKEEQTREARAKERAEYEALLAADAAKTGSSQGSDAQGTSL